MERRLLGVREAGAGALCDEFPGVAVTFDRHMAEQRRCVDHVRRIANEAEDASDAVTLLRLTERSRGLIEELCRIQWLKEARLRSVR